MKHQGTCKCGAVKIGLLADPIMKYYCHCSHCRRFASRYQPNEKPYQSACAAWIWTVQVTGTIDYEHTVGAWGLFSLARGRCSSCHDPVWEKGGRLALPYAMVMAEPLHIQPDMNIYYDSGHKKGPANMRVTIHSDWGSFLYEIWLVLTVALVTVPSTVWAWLVSNKEWKQD